jgi:CTP synthase (UTP-ammonia lyase)
VLPHLVQSFQEWVSNVARVPVDETGRQPDVCIIELGGTVGDIESGPFTEALRQLRLRTEENEQHSFLVGLLVLCRASKLTLAAHFRLTPAKDRFGSEDKAHTSGRERHKECGPDA